MSAVSSEPEDWSQQARTVVECPDIERAEVVQLAWPPLLSWPPSTHSSSGKCQSGTPATAPRRRSPSSATTVGSAWGTLTLFPTKKTGRSASPTRTGTAIRLRFDYDPVSVPSSANSISAIATAGMVCWPCCVSRYVSTPKTSAQTLTTSPSKNRRLSRSRKSPTSRQCRSSKVLLCSRLPTPPMSGRCRR